MKTKYYAVFQGHKPGLYTTWDDASQQVKGFKGAQYKSFASQELAIDWLREKVLQAEDPVADELINLIKSQEARYSSQGSSSTAPPDDRIRIYTDGGASPNPGVGGYGVVLLSGNRRKELSAGYKLTTNNRMEMLGVIVALEALKQPSDVILHTDSKYVVDSITKRWVYGWMKRGWKKSDGQRPENVDLWQRLLPLIQEHKVEFVWVKGHAGDKENERCDALVGLARNSKHLLEDSGYTAR